MLRIILSISFLLCSGLLLAQDAYYWTQDESISLYLDHTALSIHFQSDVSTERVYSLSHPDLAERSVSDMGYAERAVFLFNQSYQGSADDLRQELGLNPEEIRSLSWCYTTEDGLRLGLTYSLLYEEGNMFDPQQFNQILSETSGYQLEVSPTGLKQIHLSVIEEVLPLANRLYESGMFAYCHPDFTAKAYASSDPFYSQQFYLNNTGQTVNGPSVADFDIDAPEAWTISTGSASITVALIDEGVELHQDLEDETGTTRILTGYAPHTNSSNVSPLNPGDGHGQSVAGIVAASHNNIGVRGVAPNVKILPILVRMENTTPISDYVDGINWAYQNGGDILNNAWVFNTCATNPFPSITTALQNAYTLGRGGLGAVINFASGHDGFTCVAYPANLTEVNAIGACTQTGTLPNYSNHGPLLDFVAPSSPSASLSNIRTTDRIGTNGFNTGSTPGDLYDDDYTRYMGGTSAACSQASGIAALILSEDQTLTSAQVRNYMLLGAEDMGASGFDNDFGNGRLSAYLSLVALTASSFPVEYLDLQGKADRQEIQLQWSTASEIQNHQFVVERFDGESFQALGTVAGNGSSQSVHHYRFTDLRPEMGTNLYRLRQIDIDGRENLSPLVEVSFDGPAGAILSAPYPNPTQGQISFFFRSSTPGQYTYQLLDLQGKLIGNGKVDLLEQAAEIQLDLSRLAAGLYTFQLSTPQGQRLSQKIILE